MSIEITARNVEIPVSLQEYAKKKAAMIEADFPKTTSIRVVFELESHLYKAQMTAVVGGVQLVGSAEDEGNFIKALDDAADKLYRQARKHEDKIGDNRKA